MRHVIKRMLLGGLLCAVALTSSGCVLTLLVATLGIQHGEEFDLALLNVSGTSVTAVCFTGEGGSVECGYSFGSSLEETLSSAELSGTLGVVGLFIDPLILQLPAGVTNLAGTVDDLGDSAPAVPLVITTATSFFAQPGTEVVAEPGTIFVIIDFPSSITSTLTATGKSVAFTFQFQLVGPPGGFSGGLPVKAMFTGKVQAGGQTFYPPMLPCTTSFANVPAITIPVGSGVNLLPQILAALAQQNHGCNNAVYDFSSLSTPRTADHFQCYETADTRGSLCGAGSPLNSGGTCKKEVDCGGVDDETGFCVPKGFPKGVRVSLSDQFESGLFDVKRPVALCNPADKNDEGISDPSTHLRSYKIEAAPGQTPHTRRTNIKIQNQFHPEGELLIDTVRPDRLLVPTAKSLTQPVTAPDPGGHDVDHFKCYKVRLSKGAATFHRIPDVTIVDQFQQPGLVDVTHPTRLCTPADKNDEGIKNESNHLMCYQVIPVKQPRRSKHVSVPGIFLNNQIAPEIVDTVKEGEFCVPSLKVLPQSVP